MPMLNKRRGNVVSNPNKRVSSALGLGSTKIRTQQIAGQTVWESTQLLSYHTSTIGAGNKVLPNTTKLTTRLLAFPLIFNPNTTAGKMYHGGTTSGSDPLNILFEVKPKYIEDISLDYHQIRVDRLSYTIKGEYRVYRESAALTSRDNLNLPNYIKSRIRLFSRSPWEIDGTVNHGYSMDTVEEWYDAFNEPGSSLFKIAPNFYQSPILIDTAAGGTDFVGGQHPATKWSTTITFDHPHVYAEKHFMLSNDVDPDNITPDGFIPTDFIPDYDVFQKNFPWIGIMFTHNHEENDVQQDTPGNSINILEVFENHTVSVRDKIAYTGTDQGA